MVALTVDPIRVHMCVLPCRRASACKGRQAGSRVEAERGGGHYTTVVSLHGCVRPEGITEDSRGLAISL